VHKYFILTILASLPLVAPFAAIKRHDPTKPTVSVPDQIIKQHIFALTMIVLSGDKRYAIINGNMFAEGDTLQGFKVATIHRQSVLLKGPNGLMRKLKLVKSVVKPVSSTNKE
tara:strand:- start:1894 stop:2232 length:339 start_codon:yes stop_codon:yes gene_type:complete